MLIARVAALRTSASDDFNKATSGVARAFVKGTFTKKKKYESLIYNFGKTVSVETSVTQK